MGRTNVVSFSAAPDDHAVLRLLADMRGVSISTLCHDGVMKQLDVQGHKKRLASFFGPDNQKPEQYLSECEQEAS